MKETLISLKTAILAKEKGCTLQSKKAFAEVLQHTIFDTRKGTDIHFDYVPSVLEYSSIIHKENLFDGNPYVLIAYALTQSILKKWLRKKFNIHVEISWVDTQADIYIYHISTPGNVIRPDGKFYHSYEEALEFGLAEALKLIES